MRLLREMETIQIDITNACIHACSNCSRMCGNHKKPFFMDFETFKAAMDSLEDFEGMVGIIGGEPVLHPEFDRIMSYAGDVRKERIVQDQYFNKPKKDYLQAMYSYSAVMKQIARARGIVLTSSMPRLYYRYYERITDTAAFYRINDHSKPSYHQPSMISYKDLGISDEEFIVLRDNCWLHGKWSASIMPKGAFFCEMAGALDQLFNGPGGWKIEPGWWKREIKDYAEQWHWCELCGMCLPTCTRDANEEVDDVSETLYRMLEEIDSPRIKQGRVHLYTAKEQDERSKATIAGNYMLDYRERLGAARENLLPKSIEIIRPDVADEMMKKGVFHLYDWIAVPQTPNLPVLKSTIKKLENMFMNPGIFYQMDIDGCKAAIFNGKAFAIEQIIAEIFGSDVGKKKEGGASGEWQEDGKQVSDSQKDSETGGGLQDDGKQVSDSQNDSEAGGGLQSDNTQTSRQRESVVSNKQGASEVRWLEALERWPQAKRYTLREGFEDDPDVDMAFFEEEMLRGYRNDVLFMAGLKERLQEIIEKNAPILLPMVSNLQNMRAMARLLLAIGCDVHVMAGCIHEAGLADLLPAGKLHFFDHGRVNYEVLKAFAEELRDKLSFGGCLIPTSATGDQLNYWDGYDDAIRLMEHMKIPILGMINAKRRFCTR